MVVVVVLVVVIVESLQTMKRVGAELADATIVTQSMWEASTDGLHYLAGSNDNWNGHISNMVTQVWTMPCRSFNGFPCSGVVALHGCACL